MTKTSNFSPVVEQYKLVATCNGFSFEPIQNTEREIFIKGLVAFLDDKWERMAKEAARRNRSTGGMILIAIDDWLAQHEGIPLDRFGNEDWS